MYFLYNANICDTFYILKMQVFTHLSNIILSFKLYMYVLSYDSVAMHIVGQMVFDVPEKMLLQYGTEKAYL